VNKAQLSSSAAGNKVQNNRDYCKDEQQVNEETADMHHGETTQPKNNQDHGEN
jgi:hypothetical protein